MKEVKISICCITYNHGKFLRKCLDGILMQQLDVLYEILIHDDASKDDTADIIREYELKYPKIIKSICQTENKYSKGIDPNVEYNFTRAQGKYIALCEGDDYWTDPYKLQKQIDFLEKNDNYVMCFHKSALLEEDGLSRTGLYDNLEEREYTGEEILENWLVPTASVMFRASCLNEAYYNRAKNPKYIYGDIILFLSIVECGKIFCLQDEMAVYRIHAGGVTNKKTEDFYSRFLEHHEEIRKDFSGKYEKMEKKLYWGASYSLGLAMLKTRKVNGFKYVFRAFNYDFKSSSKHTLGLFKNKINLLINE